MVVLLSLKPVSDQIMQAGIKGHHLARSYLKAGGSVSDLKIVRMIRNPDAND
jgi:hypothetical protein